jgi:DNA mismatch repair protein MutS2
MQFWGILQQMLRTYPNTTLDKLEFEKIKEQIAGHCKSSLGKKQVEVMYISTEYLEIKKWLEQTHEFKSLTQTGTYFPLDYLVDIDKELQLLGIVNAVLSEDQLVDVKKTCLAVRSVFNFFKHDEVLYPNLRSIVADSYYEKRIVELIDAVIDEDKLVRDRASKELAQIRGDLSKKRTELNKVFNRVIQKYQQAKIIADVEQSVRNGRRVIAIQAESKRQLGGIIHDESDSGKTAYIEPAETIQLNNDIFDLERAEGREVYRVLRQLSADISMYRELLSAYQHILSQFDFIQAKAAFAIRIGASYPVLKETPEIKLRNAYHPILWMRNKQSGKETIPLTIHLNQEKRILVISGPNAGGKTICLKTVALLQVMLQSGMLIPADERSELGVFRQLYLDIGDAQSIEYELSTYSSHLQTMKHFIEFTDSKTLFFVDELGSGTDPALGGAFAEVILERLAEVKSFGVVTTHYLNLKIMANKVKGIMNGAMSFDEEKLLPLYQLVVGKPGSSYTFSIAKRSGLPESMINRAKTLVDIDHLRYDYLLSMVEILEKKVKDEAEVIQQKEKEIQSEKEEVTDLKGKLLKLNDQMHALQIAKKNTSPFVKEAERQLQKLLRDWQTKKESEKEVVAEQTQVWIEKIEKANPQPAKTKTKEVTPQLPQYEYIEGELLPGKRVYIRKMDKVGILDSVKGNKAIVMLDLLRLTVAKEELRLVK